MILIELLFVHQKYLPSLSYCSVALAGAPVIWPYSKNCLIAGGELGTMMPIFLNFLSKQ